MAHPPIAIELILRHKITLFYRTNPRAVHIVEHPPTSTAEHVITFEAVSNERVTTVDGIGGVESRKILREL